MNDTDLMNTAGPDEAENMKGGIAGPDATA